MYRVRKSEIQKQDCAFGNVFILITVVTNARFRIYKGLKSLIRA